MLPFRCIPFAICALVMVWLSSESGAHPRGDVVDIRDDKGNVLVAADRIVKYDWPTHTVELRLDEREKLAAVLAKTGKLVSGVPFTICVGGKPIYSGRFTTVASSFSFATPVIVIDTVPLKSIMNDEKLPIVLGYPTPKFFRGDDPRYDGRLYDALRAANKLTIVNRQHTEWIEVSLREMQTIKPGRTRADLLRVFAEEGGLSKRTERRYAYRDCPLIKVHVKFDPVGSPDDKSLNAPADKIREISQPFLEWRIAD